MLWLRIRWRDEDGYLGGVESDPLGSKPNGDAGPAPLGAFAILERARPHAPASPPAVELRSGQWNQPARNGLLRRRARDPADRETVSRGAMRGEFGRPCAAGFRSIRVQDLKHTFALAIVRSQRQAEVGDLIGGKGGTRTLDPAFSLRDGVPPFIPDC